jgi:hypothetical protein
MRNSHRESRTVSSRFMRNNGNRALAEQIERTAFSGEMMIYQVRHGSFIQQQRDN